MSKQYHFVVVYHSDTSEFEVDYDTQDIKFDGQPIWNNDTEAWESLEESMRDDDSEYSRVADALYFAIRNLKPLGEGN